MVDRFWFNGNIFVFRLDPDSNTPPAHINRAQIKEISWQDLQQVKVTLSGPMPAARELVALKDGDTLAILNRTSGVINEYDHKLVIIQIYNCKVIRKWFEGILQFGLDGEDAVILHVSLEGWMSFFWGER